MENLNLEMLVFAERGKKEKHLNPIYTKNNTIVIYCIKFPADDIKIEKLKNTSLPELLPKVGKSCRSFHTRTF